MFERGLCQGCGQPIHTAWDPEADRDWFADIPTRCHACTAIANRAEAYSETKHPHALHFGAEHRPRRRRPA